MGSSLGAPLGGGRSQLYTPAGTEVIFSRLQLEAYSVANALVDPVTAGAIASAPGVDSLYMLVDATPNVALWYYSTTAAAWKGVQLS